jgi:hypothetical protein
MLNTRSLNTWLGTTYTLEEVAEMDPLIFVMLNAIRQGMDPPKERR